MDARKVQPNDPLYLKYAFSVLGLSEIRGASHEKRVVAMYAACGHPEIRNDEVAWCAAFVGWCLVQAGLPTSLPTHQNLLAASYLKYPGRKYSATHVVPRGAIGVWPRSQGSGHVNFILEDQGEYLLCLGGNQENGKGGGVTISRAPKSSLRIAVLPIPEPVVAKPKPVEPKPKPVEQVPPPRQPDDPGVVTVEQPWYMKLLRAIFRR
jgi:uncharacterized protein (TIGR02594 family)